MKLSNQEARQLGLGREIAAAIPKAKRRRKRKQDGDQGRDRLFDAACKAHGLPVPVHEYRFHPTRKWRFDYLFDGWLAVEKVGGVWIRGHHSRGRDQIADMEKMNAAQIMGYIVLQFTPEQFETGAAFETINEALEGENA